MLSFVMILFNTLPSLICSSCFSFNDTASTEIYTLSLHDALPILGLLRVLATDDQQQDGPGRGDRYPGMDPPSVEARDRKSTRLNSSHVAISYAVFCLKKKKIHRPCLFPRNLALGQAVSHRSIRKP